MLGSDQMLERDDGTMLDKPASRAEAADQLRSLQRPQPLTSTRRGRGREAASAVWRHTESVELARPRRLATPSSAPISTQEYDAIRCNVGGYRIEGPGVQLFERIEGSHFTILGLPLLPLLGYSARARIAGV